MEIKKVEAVALIKVNMIITRKSENFVYEEGHFVVELPKEVATQVNEGDWIEVLCVPSRSGGGADLVLTVEHWVLGNGLGNKLYCAAQFWENLSNPPYVSKFALEL